MKKTKRATKKVVNKKKASVVSQKKVSHTKKPSSKKIKVSDIKVRSRSVDDLYELGYIKKPVNKIWDSSMILNYYFYKLPSDLKITEAIEQKARVWLAKDFYNGKRKKFYLVKEVKQPNPDSADLVPLLVVYDEDYIQRVCFFDSVCRIPENHKTSKKKTESELSEEVKEKNKIIRKENKEKELKQNQEVTETKNIKKSKTVKRKR